MAIDNFPLWHASLRHAIDNFPLWHANLRHPAGNMPLPEGEPCMYTYICEKLVSFELISSYQHL